MISRIALRDNKQFLQHHLRRFLHPLTRLKMHFSHLFFMKNQSKSWFYSTFLVRSSLGFTRCAYRRIALTGI